MERVFAPDFGGTFVVTNATSATAAVNLPETCQEIALANTSATARVHVFVTPYLDIVTPTGTAPTTSTGMPILPGQLIRVRVGMGRKVIRTIATAADGEIIVTPGNGG
jgi:hypothetical protein